MNKPVVKVSDQEIINAVEFCQGNYREAADRLRIDYRTLLNRAKHNPEITRAKWDACGSFIDMAESNVYDKVLQGDFAASKFVLERLAREKWGSGVIPPQRDYPDPIGENPFTYRETL